MPLLASCPQVCQAVGLSAAVRCRLRRGLPVLLSEATGGGGPGAGGEGQGAGLAG